MKIVRHDKKKRATPAARSSPLASPACELCAQTGGRLLWRDAACRVVLVADPAYPGYCRVIWNAHVREMTNLAAAERRHCMHVVFAVEQVLRAALDPHKINLASLGNLTPHLHWHVIPRYENDPHFPNSIWGERLRAENNRTAAKSASKLGKLLTAELAKSL